MTDMRVVIVDDEPMARQALARMLVEFPEVEVCGEAGSVDEAEKLIMGTRAEVVYLDIELFGESGFDLVPRLKPDVAVVFVTAFNQYAVRAFEVNALDYLLKPVTKKRLAETIRRLSDHHKLKSPSPGPGRLNNDDVILVQDGKRRQWIELQRVSVIEASGDYTVLQSADGLRGSVWRSLNEWEQLLSGEQFIRIHRGLVINLDHVESFETASGKRLGLHLAGVSEPRYASRRHTPQLRQILLARPS